MDLDVDSELDLGPKQAQLIDKSAGRLTKEAGRDWSRHQSSNQFQFGTPDGCRSSQESPQGCSSGPPSCEVAGRLLEQPPPSSKSLESPSRESTESMEWASKTTGSHKQPASDADELQLQANLWELRLLVRRREAGALIGKRGSNIKRLRDNYRSCMLSIPDTGNGPERIACILADQQSMAHILADVSELLLEKSAEKDDQIELKLLIHSSQAGSIIGVAGQSIKKLRNESKAAIKIYELCCPYSNERVCAIKAKPPVVVSTIQQLQAILGDNPPKGPLKPYDASHYDPMLCDKYGGYLPDEPLELLPGLGPLSAAVSLDSAATIQAYTRLSEAASLQSSLHLAHQHHQHQLAAAFDQTTRHNHYQRMLYQHHHQQAAISAHAMAPRGDPVSRRKNSPLGDVPSQPIGAEAHDSECSKQSKLAKAPSARSARFHPYSAEARIPSMHQVARFAAHQRLVPLQPSLFQHQHQQLLAGLSQTTAPLNRCRHLRPCLCMLMGPAATHRGLQPFAANLINYTTSSRVPPTTTKDAGCFVAKKK